MYDRNNLKNIPKKPGIYIMHNHAGDIIYVGKAKNLFNRVHSYFQNPKKLPIKTQIQVSHVESIETIVVDTEKERATDRADVSMGSMQLWEYRMKWYGEDEKTAKAMVNIQEDVIE